MASVLDKFQYGIELECFAPYFSERGNSKSSKDETIDRIYKLLINAGYSEEYSRQKAIQKYDRGDYSNYNNFDLLRERLEAINVGVGEDGSINCPDGNNELEIRAGVYDDSNFEENVEKICAIADEHEAKVNQSCGFHLHTSHSKFLSRPVINRLVHTWAAIEDVLFLTQPKSRFSNSYCHRLLKPFISGCYDDLPAEKRALACALGNVERYCALNLNALYVHQTVEVRLHSGTLDKTKIVNWMRLIRSIFVYVFDKYDKKTIHEIFLMPINKEKVKRVFDLLGLDQDLRAHFLDRIDKFYSQDNWESYTNQLAKQNADANNAMLKKDEFVKFKRRHARAARAQENAYREMQTHRRSLEEVVNSLS